MSTPRSLPRHCHHVSAERRCFKTEKTNWETVENRKTVAARRLICWVRDAELDFQF